MRWPWNRNKELNEELESHFRMAVQDRVAAGASERDALAAARREFGNVGLVKEVTRDIRGGTSVENLFRDLRYALRQLRKSPGFTLAAVLTLALGIGGTTAIFSLMEAVMLRSLPVADPASLYRIGDRIICCDITGSQNNWGMYSFSLFERLKHAAPEFQQLAAFSSRIWDFGVQRSTERSSWSLRTEYVSGNYFSMLGIQSFAGRLFSSDDDRRTAAPVAVLSYRAWRGKYGGAPSLIGSTLIIDNHPFTVIGIAPPGFFGETLRSDPPEIWLPVHQEALIDGQGSLLDQTGVAVCALVLLIACANIANLLLARGMARRSDTALRLAMGASSRRLVSQALTESILLAIAGGVAGLAVAYGAERLLLALAFQSAHFIPIDAGPSLPVLGFAFALSLLTGIVFGTAPAWLATHTNPIDALRGGHRSMGGRTSFSRNALLAVQATLSVVLVAGAAMLARSLSNLEHQNFGFATANRIAMQLNVPQTYSSGRLDALYRKIEDRLHHLPGVKRVGLTGYNPLTDAWGDSIFIAGNPSPHPVSGWDRVSPGYLQTLGEPIIRGRGFTKYDTGKTALIAVVNQAFAKRYFPGKDPIGKHFGLVPENASMFRIVGVVRGAKFIRARRVIPMFFVPLAQSVHYGSEQMQNIELRSHLITGTLLETHLPPGALEPVLKKTLAEVDPNLTILSIRTMRQQVAMNFDQERAVASLAGLFGIVALILAAVGLYGVLAYSVTQRTSEIGVRMALGADRASVIRLVLRGAFNRAAVGLLLGIPLAMGAGRLISSQLYGVSA